MGDGARMWIKMGYDTMYMKEIYIVIFENNQKCAILVLITGGS
jgi:hypothetical protein